MNRLEDAIMYATEHHAGQTDKAGQPYILHPLTVMLGAHRRGLSEDAQIAAVLHDVPEDSGVPIVEIRHRWGQRVATLVWYLTSTGLTREEYEDRIIACPDDEVPEIKLLDVNHNLNPLRLQALTARERRHCKRKYVPFRERLWDRLDLL